MLTLLFIILYIIPLSICLHQLYMDIFVTGQDDPLTYGELVLYVLVSFCPVVNIIFAVDFLIGRYGKQLKKWANRPVIISKNKSKGL